MSGEVRAAQRVKHSRAACGMLHVGISKLTHSNHRGLREHSVHAHTHEKENVSVPCLGNSSEQRCWLVVVGGLRERTLHVGPDERADERAAVVTANGDEQAQIGFRDIGLTRCLPKSKKKKEI